MNFEFSEEQNLLREQARGFLGEHSGMSVVREVLDGEQSYDKDLWKKVADMGWTATVIPEEYDGLGLSYFELSVIAEELGRSFAPIPFSSSVYLATEAILAAGSVAQKERWLPKLAAGSAIGCLAVSEANGQISAKTMKTIGDRSTVSGTKLPVTDGDIADFAVVFTASKKGDGMSAYLVDLDQVAVSRSKLNSIDNSRSQASLSFNGASAELLGADGEGAGLLENLYNRAAVLFAWEQVGGADVALNMAKEYALGRFAFGKPIATYQAIKHKMANMYVKNTLARSNCYYGAWALATDSAELSIAAATARVASIQAYYFASKENIQIHGGMGFTWEFDCQFPYRRSKILSVNLGGEAVWQEKLIKAIEQERAA